MADTPIKHNELIEENVFQPTSDSADVLLEKLSLLIGGFKELAKITGAKINAGIDPKTIGDIDKLTQAKEKLANIEKGLTEFEKIQIQTKEKIRQARVQETDQLKSQDGVLGNLLIKKKELQKGLISAKTAGDIKRINEELFKTNGQIREIKEGGVKSFNTWGNALQSFQFKFNALGSTIGTVLGNFASGALSGGIGFLTSGLSFLADSFTRLIFPIQQSSDEISEQTKRIKELAKESEAERKINQQRSDDLESVGFSTIQSKEAQDELIESLNKEVETLIEVIDAEEELRATRKGGLRDLERELDVIRASSDSKITISKKEKQILEVELSDLLDRQKRLGDFALSDIELQQKILDKKNEIAVIEAKINKDIQDEKKRILKENADMTREALDKELKYRIQALSGEFGEAEQLISKQAIETRIALGFVTPEELKAYNDSINNELKRNADEKSDALDKFIKYEIDALSGKFGKEEQIIAKQEIATKIALGIATPEEIAAFNADAKAERDKRIKDELETANQLNDIVFDSLEKRNEKEKQINEEKITEIDRQIQFQQQLALNGEKNTLAELEKERAKALEEKAKIDKKAARQKEAEQLAEIFLEFYKAYASEKEGAFGKALTATAKAVGGKLIARALAGSFATGVEDFKGKGTGTSDSNIIGFSRGESVLTAKGTKETSGLASAVNERGYIGAKEWAMENVFPKVPMLQDKSRSEQLGQAMMGLLNNRLQSLEQTIKNKTEWTISENLFGEIVKARKQNGINRVTTVKNTPIINGK